MGMNNMFDLYNIRSNFPIFNQPDLPPLVFLDNASTTQKPTQVLEAVNQFYCRYNANVHRGIYKIAEQATEAYESVRDKVAEFIGTADRRNIVFTKSTTESINLVAYSWARKFLKTGDEILVTEMEHHSNLVPWQLAAQHTGATLKYIPLNKSGSLDMSSPERYFTKNTKLVAISHQSNVLGTINSVKEIIGYARDVGAKTLIDGAQFVPHSKLDVQNLDCDFYVFSGHKMMGPTGVGILYGKADMLETMDPFLGGGDMILSVTMEKAIWNDIPYKFEAGTPNIAQVIGLGAAIDFMKNMNIDSIDSQVRMLTSTAVSRLREIKGLTVLGHENGIDSTSVISFFHKDIHPHDIAHLLDTFGISVRAGHHCAQPVMDKYDLSASVRVSFYVYNTIDEIEQLISGLQKTMEYFR